MNKRELQILDIVTERERIEVATLAEMLEVSPVTIRKALDMLETKGLIRREHGYAIASSKDDINNRLAINYEVKQRIAKAAAELVSSGQTVTIESGSSCALLADLIANTKPNVTIISNSAFIANYIKNKPYAKLILMGGDYQTSSQVMVGPLVKKCMEEFFVEKMFIGTDGFSEMTGFTGKDMSRAEAVQNMAEKAKDVIVLTDSSKFSQQGVVSLLPFNKISVVITDEGMPEDKETYLKDKGIQVIKV
jgi:DeoR/GlpR family transcriptional regulator of sugar metabolism